MVMLNTSRTLGKLIETYVLSAMDGGRDCRLLVPGLTLNIAREVHEYLIKNPRLNGVKSYLIIGEDEQPDEAEGRIGAAGLTSRRIGSFIAIVNPGQLAQIQDSIRGSGGTIRSLAFSEEWPWIDNGSEQFRFDGPVLDAIVKEWSSDQTEQEWLRSFILDGLVKHTRSHSRRAQVLLEEILGEFNPTLYPEVADIREKFLFHAGIPRPTGTVPPVKDTIQYSVKLCKDIVDRCQKNEGVREQARNMILEIADIPSNEREDIRQSLDQLLDGMGRSSTLDLGLLAFHGCWGHDREDTSHWRRLHADRLADLFDVRLRPKAEVSYDLRCERGLVSDDRKKLATFFGEDVALDIEYKIAEDQFRDRPWEIQVLNRQRTVVQQSLVDNEGMVRLSFNTSNVTSNYSHKIPLRIALVSDEGVQADARLNLHLCGEGRPAFVVVEHLFDVVDATETSEEEISDKKINTNLAVHLFLFSYGTGIVALSDEDDRAIDIVETGTNGIWRSAHRVDVTAGPSGQVTRICKFGNLNAVISLEATDLEKGEFTLEDELRVNVSRGKEKPLQNLADIFKGRVNEPYLSLGKIDDATRRRIRLTNIVTTQTGWRPLLANLLVTDNSTSGSLGNYINHLGQVDAGTAGVFTTLELPEEVLPLLSAYSKAREAVFQEIKSRVYTGNAKIEHPIYASHPIYVHDYSQHIEDLLCKYLEAYSAILAYIKVAHTNLEWGQLFILTHIDCVVHWDNQHLRGFFFLIGPWHPLVLAKRFMVQAALYSRADRYLNDKVGGKAFRQLCSLLGQVQGFRWTLSLSTSDRTVEHAFVYTTSDPGWHVAVQTNFPSLPAREGIIGLPELAKVLWLNLGLAMGTGDGGVQNLPVTALSNYLRAFPSRRSIGVRIRRGYTENEVVRDVDTYLHADEGPTEQGEQLPGGIRLYLEEPLERDVDARWSDPPLCIYQFEDDERCIQEGHPDIYMLPPLGEVSFKLTPNIRKLPRGTGRHAVFSEPLRRLEEGNTFIPKSFTYELDFPCGATAGIGGMYTAVLGQVTGVLGNPVATVSSIELPHVLKAPWVVIPGQSIDPAILVKYVRDGADRLVQDRALWDYSLDLAGRLSSFYILSTIPRGFQLAVDGFFNKDDIAREFIVELGNIGIAIGGEALKSGRHALGIIGLVGAVRLFVGQTNGGQVPLSSSSGSVGFLVPVDSFASFFGNSSSSEGKRTDLLAVQLVLPSHGSGKMRISACGVESKFVSGTFGQARAHAALEQGLATVREFKELVITSLKDGAMPERLGLLELLRFGLRVTCPSAPEEIDQWLDTEGEIYQAILAGEYEYSDAVYSAVLVSTEGSLPGVAESRVLPDGLWIRLTKDHWPGIADTPSVDSIRHELCTLFRISGTSSSWSPSPADIPSAPQEREEEPEELSSLQGLEPEYEPHAAHVVGPQVGSEPVKPDAPLKGIFIGADEARGMVYFNPQSPIDPLDNMNIMVTGSSGKGKTQFLKYLICKFREQGKNVLILDFKNDFASDLTFCEKAGLEKVFVTFDGLPYNPLIPYPIQHPESGELYIQSGHHIAGIASVLKRTYRLGDQQQAAVKRAINMAFAGAGIQTTGSTPFTSDILFPDFSDVGDLLQNENPTAYNRLDPLFTLDLFRNDYRDQSFHALVNRAVVIDLSQIPSDEIKNALAQLIVLSAHAYYNAQPHSGTIRQFLVFDEAHRVLSSDYMLRLVRECRAYGVGVVLSSQYPSDFPGEISSSMATKIIHGNDRDAERTRAIVQLLGCEGREGEVASLERFKAIMDNRHHPQTLLRTMNYPLYLVWVKLQELGTATREDLSRVKGIDTSKLPIVNLVHQLELLGLAEQREGKIIAIGRNAE